MKRARAPGFAFIDPRIAGPAAALLALLIFNGLFSRGFFTLELRGGMLYGGVVDVFDNAAPLILIALGMALVIGSGGIDLSVGAVMAITGAVVAGLVAQPSFSILSRLDMPDSTALAIAIALAAGCAAGAINGALVAYLGVQPLMATLVLMVSGRGIAQLLTDGQITTFHDPVLSFIGSGGWLGLPARVWIAFAAIGLVSALTRLTALGLFTEAIGDNRAAATLSGLPVRGVVFLAYLLTGFLAGAAGIIEAADIAAADSNNAGLYIELDAILAVVLGGAALTGGRFSILGAVIGALLIQTLTTTILAQGVPEKPTLLIKALVVIAICLLQSEQFRGAVKRPFTRMGSAA